MPIVTLQTGETVHTGHLTGQLGGNFLADVILDLVGGRINASPDHATLVLPAQTKSLLAAGRPMAILPALYHAATSIDPVLPGQSRRQAW